MKTTKNTAIWGTYGINSDQPLRWKRLVDCDTDHLQNILCTQKHVYGTVYEKYIRSILSDRGEKPASWDWAAYREFAHKYTMGQHGRTAV